MPKTTKLSPLSSLTCRHPLELHKGIQCKICTAENYMAITAKGTFNGHDLTDLPVLNPGGWFGKAWLVEIGGSY